MYSVADVSEEIADVNKTLFYKYLNWLSYFYRTIGLQMPIYFQFIAYLLVNMYIVTCPTTFLLIIVAILRETVDRE